jgi:hypothetical protein
MKAIGVIIMLVLAAVAGNYAMGAMHLGAPDFYPDYQAHCPRGTHFKSWWVRSSDPRAFGYYRGWQELGGCGQSTQLSIGGSRMVLRVVAGSSPSSAGGR